MLFQLSYKLLHISKLKLDFYCLVLLNCDFLAETCKCPEYLKVNWWKIPPYTNENALNPGGIFSHAVKMMLEMCGTCPNGHGKTKACYSPGCDQQSSRRRRAVDTFQQEGLQQVIDNINDDVDISFPIQGNKYLTHYGGEFSYISIVETSGSAYFTVRKTPSTSHVVLSAAFYSIPMLLLFFLLSVLAGFIIWILVSIIRDVFIQTEQNSINLTMCCFIHFRNVPPIQQVFLCPSRKD